MHRRRGLIATVQGLAERSSAWRGTLLLIAALVFLAMPFAMLRGILVLLGLSPWPGIAAEIYSHSWTLHAVLLIACSTMLSGFSIWLIRKRAQRPPRQIADPRPSAKS